MSEMPACSGERVVVFVSAVLSVSAHTFDAFLAQPAMLSGFLRSGGDTHELDRAWRDSVDWARTLPSIPKVP